jgi:hypothetical protein
MNHTLTAPVAGFATDRTTNRATRVRPGLLGGIGGLVFVGAVIAQNAIRSGFPMNDASTEEVVRYYADHRSATVALSVLFPIGLVGLVTFLGTVVSRVARGTGRAAAFAGAFGAAAIIAIFTLVTSADVAIAAYIHRGAADPSVVEGLWVLHNAVFGFLMAAIGIALAGLTTAAAKTGLLSQRWAVAGPIGAALTVAAAATTPAMVAGSPTFFIGAAGFLVWIAFVVRTAIALLRSQES